MTTINVYLTFDGNCKEAFDFYRSVFGGEFPYVGTFGEMPPQEGMPPIPDDMKDRIMHISLAISEDTVLMGSDTGGEWGANFKQGNNFSMSLTTDDKDDANRIFNELSNGGEITMPMQDTFWGDYFGTIVDKFGINWMISFREVQQG